MNLENVTPASGTVSDDVGKITLKFSNFIDASTVEGNVVKVEVGEVEHPMLEEHYIGFVAIETKNGAVQKKYLNPGEKPVAEFVLAEGDELVAAYEYCNLHGLWKK